MNLLTDALPDFVTVDGASYPIHSDFRTWIKFETLMSESPLPAYEKLANALILCYKALPPSLDGAVSAMLGFYEGAWRGSGGKSAKNPSKRLYSFTHDSGYIYGAFWECYGIDLSFASLHWWQFQALFRSLGDTKFTRIMGYRSVNLSDIKNRDEKRFYARMQSLFRLPDVGEEAGSDEALAAALSEIF